MESTRKHLTYANIVSTLCLFVLLGGVAAAVDGPNPGQNTIGSEDIIGNEVKSDDIGNGRIFNLDIADEIITGQKLKNGTVGAADLAPGTMPADATCPSGLSRLLNTSLCYENQLRTPTVASAAALDCGFDDLSLPTPSEAMAISNAEFLEDPESTDEIWSDLYWADNGQITGVSVSVLGFNSENSGNEAFRCTTYASDAG